MDLEDKHNLLQRSVPAVLRAVCPGASLDEVLATDPDYLDWMLKKVCVGA